MDGNVAPLPEICDLAEKYDALVFIDECHATGFLGQSGRGTEEFFGETLMIETQLKESFVTFELLTWFHLQTYRPTTRESGHHQLNPWKGSWWSCRRLHNW